MEGFLHAVGDFKSVWKWGILLEGEGQTPVPGGLQISIIFGFWRQAREQPREPSCKDKFHVCSSLRLNLLLKRQKLCGCCHSCVSQIQLTAMWMDHWIQVKPGHREIRKAKKGRTHMKDGEKSQKSMWHWIKLSPEHFKHCGVQHLDTSCCSKRTSVANNFYAVSTMQVPQVQICH